ncbi:MAG: AI-2E family transporter [Clostridia bacterium]|nr:AI-2E family transporter [Clostridia bacterium]
MQKEHTVRYAAERLALRLLFTALAAVFVMGVVPEIWRLLSPFLVAVPVAAALQPSIRFLQEKLRFRRGLAVTLGVLLVCSAAFVFIYWVISFLVVQLSAVVNNAPSIMAMVTDFLQAAANRILDAAQTMPENIGQAIRASLESALGTLSTSGIAFAGNMGNLAISFAASLPYAFIYINFLVLGIFFITSRFPGMLGFIRKNTALDSGDGIVVLRKSAAKGMLGYIRVQLLFSLVTLLLSWICFQSFGFRYAMLIALVGALMELIPQFGCGTLYLPWAVISFIVGQDRNGWIVLGLYLVYQLIRRLTEPMLLGSNLGVSPLLSLIGMFAGLHLGGIVGLILGPVVMVVIVSAVRARLFDGVVMDCRALSHYLRDRWQRGKKRTV